MAIEQIDPDKPNFGLIVALFCGTILVMLILGVLFVKMDGKHMFRHHSPEPHSMVVAPTTPTIAA